MSGHVAQTYLASGGLWLRRGGAPVAPPVERRLGLNHSPIWQTETGHVNAVELLVAAGCEKVRIPVYWNLIESAKGTRSGVYVTRLDSFIGKCDAAGIDCLLVFQGSPDWAALGGAGSTTTGILDANFPDFADFVAWCIDRWYGNGVDAVEVWNEPNLGQFWSGASYSGGILGNSPGTQLSKYSDLLKVVYPAAKNANAECPVVGGGTFTAQYGVDWRCTAFIDALTSNDGWDYMDVFSFHNYPKHVTAIYGGLTPPTQPWYNKTAPDQSIMGQWESRILPEMVTAGVGSMPVWFTETGFTTVGTGTDSVTEAQQAAKIEELGTTFAAAQYPTNIQRIYYYSMYDGHASQNADPEYNWGLINNNDESNDNTNVTPKPSWVKFVSATKGIVA